MGQTKFALGMSAALLAALAAVACSGADGERGPAGAEGKSGDPGTPGKDGVDGTDGKDGKDGKDGADGDAGIKGDPGEAGPTKPSRLLDSKIGGWVQGNRDALNDMITKHGIASPTFDATRRPVAVFDWDNTVIKNDIGDATFAWMVRHDLILQPPGKDWGQTNPDLAAAARAALNAACDAAAAAGAPLPTSTTAACAAELMNIYYNGKTAAGTAAWTDANKTTMNEPYAWVSQLQAGHTPEEVRAWARAAFEENVNAPIGAKQTVGGVELAGYLRVYEQIRDLAETLDENGFDVWVLTASPQYVVDGLAEEIGVPPHKVVGIRPVLANGKITYGFLGCGALADGQTSLITYYAGKRCWINKAIFGEPAASQLGQNADSAKRPAFVAGDSDTDIVMLKDATVLKLAIERGKSEISCNAYQNANAKWLHQPMFIEPKAAPAAGAYACPTYKDPDGAAIVNEAGQAFTVSLP
jgi:phosphoserine phosphatase